MHKTISEIYELYKNTQIRISYRGKFLEIFHMEIEQEVPIVLYYFILENGEEFVFPEGVEFLVEVQ